MKINSLSYIISGLVLGGCLLTACDEKDKPYVGPEDAPTADLTLHLADSIWNEYNTLYPFSEATEMVPTSEADTYYEDYADNWLVDEDTRDVTITFDGEQAIVEFDAETQKKDKKYVRIVQNGAHITIYNDSVLNGVAEGRARMNYILKGQTSEGSIRVYSNKKFMITLDGVSLSNARGAAINVQKSLDKKRVFVNIADGTVNTLCDAEVYTDTIEGEDDKGCLFSEGKLILMGNGQLTVTGNYNHAIAADDRIHIHSGVQLRVIGNKKDGIHVNDELVMSGGQVEVWANKDAVQCDSLSDGLILRGGRLLTCAKRALSVPTFNYAGGSFCLIGTNASTPTAGLTNWSYAKQPDGYMILESN